PLTADAITIDGCSSSVCPGAVTIDGSATTSTAPADGIQICSSNDVIRGLKIVNFGRAGVAIDPECTPVSFSVANRVELNDLDNNHFARVLVKNPAQVGAPPSIGNLISRNTIVNSPTLIDLNGDGPTPNDPGDTDNGPNFLQNYPDNLQAQAVGN